MRGKREGQQRTDRTCALAFGCICLLAWLVLGNISTAAEKTEHTLQFFFENVCASCHEEDHFYDLFNRCVTSEEKQGLSYEIRTYNVFQDAAMEAYEQALAEYGKSRTDFELPVLLVDGQWISGYEAMEAQLHDVLLNGKQAETKREAFDDGQETDEMQTDALAAAQDVRDAFGEQGISQDTPAALLFTTYSCSDCEAAKQYLEDLKNKTDFYIEEANVAQGENLGLFKSLLKLYGRSDEEGKVPAVFAGDQVFLGKDEIQEGLESLLSEEKAPYKTLAARLSEADRQGEAERVSLPVMFGAGLLAGFNPCSISMLLMLFSLLLTARASILKNGLLYLAGKYVTYLGLGLVICLAAAQVSQEVLDRFGRVTGLVIAALFLAAAVLNFLDFLNVRKQEYGKVRMQLPKGLRRFNHRLLKRTEHMEGALLSLLVLGLGIAVSLGEFFCTGQIYMASLLYLLRNGKEQLLQLVGTLTVYVTAMSLPAAVILAVIARTKGTEQVSEFMLKHMDAIKLLNTILFLLYAVYFVIR